MTKNLPLRLLSLIVIAYMLLAFTWWSVLLYTKNKDAFRAKTEYLTLIMVAEGEVNNKQEFLQTEVYQELARKYQRQEWMILGEALVFVISLVIGMWLINRGYNNQINAARQRRNFLLSITHELKSPIASIRLILETFQKRKLTEPQIAKFSESAIQEADRLNGLVNDLLLAAKIETAYQPLVEDIPLAETLENIIGKLKVKFPQAQFDLKMSPSEIIYPGDKLGINSTLINLLENAVKYSPEDAQIVVRVVQNQQKLSIEVADQGMGISDAEKKKIFDKFYRVGSEETRETKGTGLGLFIVDQIIKAHHGKISVRDNQPKGTVFKIHLPLDVELQSEAVFA